MGTRARVTTVAGAATLLCAVYGAAPAFAAPVSTAAAPQTLIGACGDTVRGDPGQPVGVRVAGLSVIHLGHVPSSGATTFDASSILQDLLGPGAPNCQVTARANTLPAVLAPVGAAAAPVLGAVQDTAGPISGAPQQPAPGAPAAPPPAPGTLPDSGAAAPAPVAAPVHGPVLPQFTPFALGRYHSGMPLYDYATLLIGRPGGFGRLQTGTFASDLLRASANSLTIGAQDPAAKDVAAAGQASALPASAAERIALPVLVAVLMLAAVTAAVIRSWVVVTRR